MTSITHFIKLFLAVGIPLAIMDAIWLFTMSKPFYGKYLGSLMSSNPIWIAAVLFYIVYIIGVIVFVVNPALSATLPWYQVVIRGAFFGLVAYATYDLTNHATLVGWSSIVTVVDLIWGSFLTATASLVAYLFLR